MSGATRRANLAPPDSSAPGTLGDILFAGGTAAPPETEWAALVRSIAARDQRALQALVERTHRIVFTLVLRITCDRQTAEELTLDVFHDVWRRSPDYDPVNGSVVGWVMNQARSRAIDRLRFEQRKKRVNPHTLDGEGDEVAIGPHDALALRQETKLLREAMAALSADERLAIETAFLSGLTYDETAARLGLPVGTVKSRIRSGLAKLRKAMTEESP